MQKACHSDVDAVSRSVDVVGAGRPGQTEASEAAELLGREASQQARAVLYAGFGSVARAVSGAGEQAKIAGHMASLDAHYLADQAANLSAMYYGQAAAAIGEISWLHHLHEHQGSHVNDHPATCRYLNQG